MPTHNAGTYISAAIASVLNQSCRNWELLIINDGSTDSTDAVVKQFLGDARIIYFKQVKKGVGAARNLGLANMRGDYFCFLDADDFLPSNSLRSRLDIFKKAVSIQFVDGVVEKRDSTLQYVKAKFIPDFNGKNPLDELVKLSGKCFFGPSWMIKAQVGEVFQFKESLSHAEDLLFYIDVARRGGNYSFTTDTIYIYRKSPGSAMTNLEGLENGYWQVYNEIRNWPELRRSSLRAFRNRVKKIMFLSYLRAGELIKALKVFA